MKKEQAAHDDFLENVSLYLDHVGDDNLQLADDRDPGRRLEVHGKDEAVLLYQAQDAHADGHRPFPEGGHAGPPHGEEADGPADGGGEAQVEEDDGLLHPLGDELGGHHAGRRGDAGQAHHDVACGEEGKGLEGGALQRDVVYLC